MAKGLLRSSQRGFQAAARVCVDKQSTLVEDEEIVCGKSEALEVYREGSWGIPGRE